jgi:anti-sigma-K factor RskA
VDTKEYILSGIIEAYVLGLASPEEVREVEGYAMQYIEVKDAITDFEIRLEKEALNSAIAPPAFLKDKVMSAIDAERTSKTDVSAAVVTETPAVNPLTKPATKVVPLMPAPKGVKWLRGAVAASVILLLGSAILNFYYYSQYKKFNQQYSQLLASQTTLMAKNDAFKANLITLSDTSVVKVTMQAPSAEKLGAVATVFWNKKSQEVYLTVNNLPVPSSGKQYQLWAIVDGKPVDAGMVNTSTIGDTSITSKMQKIGNAQAFAITLEDEGGSPSPHLEQLYVLGKV